LRIIAKMLGVEAVYVTLPEVSSLERQIANLLSSGKEIPEEVANVLEASLPRHFTVYYLSSVDPKDPEERPHRLSHNTLTKEGVESLKVSGAYISEKRLNILEIRGLLQQMSQGPGWLLEEDKAIFKRLKQIVF